LATEVGLAPGTWVNVDCPWAYPDLETELRAFISAGPMIRAISNAGEDAVRQVETEALTSFRMSDASYRLENKFRYMMAFWEEWNEKSE